MADPPRNWTFLAEEDTGGRHISYARKANPLAAHLKPLVGVLERLQATLTNYFNQLADTEVDFPRVPVSG